MLIPSSFSKFEGLTLLLPRAEERWGAGGGHPHWGKWGPHAADWSSYAPIGVHHSLAQHLSQLPVTPPPKTPRCHQPCDPVVTLCQPCWGVPVTERCQGAGFRGRCGGVSAGPAPQQPPALAPAALGAPGTGIFHPRKAKPRPGFKVSDADGCFPGTRFRWRPGEARRVFLRLRLAVLKMAAITCSSRAAALSEWGPLHPTLLLEGHPQPPLLAASPHFCLAPARHNFFCSSPVSPARQNICWRPRSRRRCPPPAPKPSGTVPAPWQK